MRLFWCGDLWPVVIDKKNKNVLDKMLYGGELITLAKKITFSKKVKSLVIKERYEASLEMAWLRLHTRRLSWVCYFLL